ncbi:MAG: hypothetical protein AAGA08_12340 [Pseudomonadota bacterium]
MTAALAQNLDCAVIAFEHAMRDWTDYIRDCAVPIDLIQGRHDAVAGADGVAAMAAAYPDKMVLHMIEDGGYMLYLSHTRDVVGILLAAARV